MPPRTRQALREVQAEVLTDTADKASDGRDDLDVPSKVRGKLNKHNVSLTSPEQASKRKRGTKSPEQRTMKKSRLGKTASAQLVSAENNLKDSLREGLILISIGLNPGIMTGKLGHAYAHPSNRYWPMLYLSGITPEQHKPADTLSLMDLYSIGHTNIIPTLATKGGNDLTTQDYLDGAKVLDEKIRELKPQAVMIVGKGIWEEWVRYKKGRKYNAKKDGPFEYGWQDENLWIGRKDGEFAGARTFVVTTTSGLSSSHTKEQRIEIWKPMGDWFAPIRDDWIIEQGKENAILAIEKLAPASNIRLRQLSGMPS